jgi:hypothetical protein
MENTNMIGLLVCEACPDSADDMFNAHTFDPDNFEDFRETHKGHEIKEYDL